MTVHYPCCRHCGCPRRLLSGHDGPCGVDGCTGSHPARLPWQAVAATCDDEYTNFGDGGWWWECPAHGSNGPHRSYETAKHDHDQQEEQGWR